MKVIGIVPARMAASRFPGKPLEPILGRPMLEHVFERARLYEGWDRLALATCDDAIQSFGEEQGYETVLTGAHHSRALDRVAEAAAKLDEGLADDDIVVCVQGDEPMLTPEMVAAVVDPIKQSPGAPATVLAVHITEESVWLNPDTVKIAHNAAGEILYTSRAPIPYAKNGFSEALMARRVSGIFAFEWRHLKAFTEHPETRLEQLEACDSNRILDMSFRQVIAPYPACPFYSVDSPEDISLVESAMENDPLHRDGRY